MLKRRKKEKKRIFAKKFTNLPITKENIDEETSFEKELHFAKFDGVRPGLNSCAGGLIADHNE